MAAPPVVQYTHASIAERRIMRKNAIPEHAYTGYVGCIHPDNDFAFFRYVPKDTREQPDDPKPVVGKIKHAIVGYRGRSLIASYERNTDVLLVGHRHNKEAMIGTTFTRGLEIVPQPVRLRKPYAMPQTNKQLPISASGYGGFDKLSGYGQFLSRSQAGGQVADASGYGEMDNETQYGQFAAPPRPHDDVRSTYGEFAQASKYGQFAPPPAESGYGKFEKMSGYGQFAPPPAESGYGKFEKMSGYGQFAPPPAESEYGKFQDTSNYGQFAPPPPSNNAENASGHRQGAAALPNKPIPQDRTHDRGKPETIPTSHVRPENPPHDQLTDPHKPPLRVPRPPLNEIRFDDLCRNEGLRDAYIRVLRRVGGAPAVASLFQRISNVLRQQKGSKTETKQRVKVAFDLVVSRGLNII
ncbi:hypothetical protein DYB36_002260 [Aphanomyces astaci]|uniref:Uncharacterized protein n=1 Tax=Aphanomyces astaci TaxID=112090 RepID=A0A397A7T3_APHAT|nr:hypothetical protein DYB36_002260 [Aphanomyces astaci]